MPDTGLVNKTHLSPSFASLCFSGWRQRKDDINNQRREVLSAKEENKAIRHRKLLAICGSGGAGIISNGVIRIWLCMVFATWSATWWGNLSLLPQNLSHRVLPALVLGLPVLIFVETLMLSSSMLFLFNPPSYTLSQLVYQVYCVPGYLSNF